MINVEEASILIKEHMQKWEASASLKENLYADRDYPPFNRVMMDGIAVSFDSYEKGQREFIIMGVCPAGSPSRKLADPVTCFEVMTGAPLPHQTDLIIQYEHLIIEEGVAKIILEVPRSRFESVHIAGSDCKKGEVVLSAPAFMHGPHVGIAASMGYDQIKTEKSHKIMIISTGDELVEVDQKPLEHQIRRSNVYALKKSLEINGFENITLAHLNDDPKEIADHYQKTVNNYDILIYSGGVSKGKFDYLPKVWSDLGVKKYFHEVSQRPGKPLWFGVDEKNKTSVLGLPGNPVSSLVCLHRYIIPGRRMYARLSEEVIFTKHLTFFLPVKIFFMKDGFLQAEPLKIKNSGDFTSLAHSDGFIELPKEQSVFKKGESFVFYPWRNF